MNEEATGPVWCVVVAAGRGSRFGGPKQQAILAGRTVLERSVATAGAACDGVVVVVRADWSDRVDGADRVVVGGATRSASVASGLDAVPADAAVVLVHDAARPLASPELYRRVIEAVRSGADAVVPVVAVTDTIRHLDGGTVDRDLLRAVQTPQGFRVEALRAAHRSGGDATDDATLVEAVGGSVELVDGERTNLKITEPSDLDVAEALLRRAAASTGGDTDGAPGGDSLL